MKLTKHQKEIVDKIISGEISDIPSYLRVFLKAHNRQYDPQIIQAIFEEKENGSTYFFKEEDYNFYTEMYDRTGNLVKILPVANKMTYELKQYPLTSPVFAQLDMTIHPEQISFRGIDYSFNFMKNEYLVADTFSDIRDFVALWSYLRREALVFEGNKPVKEEDLSIFFEYTDQDISPQINPRWHQQVDIDSETEDDPVPRVDIHMIPKKSANHYIEKAWKMNHEHLAMCDEYIGIKMLATSELKNYQQSGYKTVEEKSQSRNLFAAWAAVAISLISVAIGNILPLFQKADTEYLDYISKQIAVIEERMETNAVSQDILSELGEIHDELMEIKDELEEKTPEGLTSAVEDVVSQLKELNRILGEKGNDGP